MTATDGKGLNLALDGVLHGLASYVGVSIVFQTGDSSITPE